MKKLLLLLLACGMLVSAFAQNPQEPCCGIIAMDIKNNLVVARDNTTGRLYQFKADALDMKAIKLNDAVNISAGKVTSISGAKRTYVTVRPDPAFSCCNVVSIQVDGGAPCCFMVNIINNTTNTNLAISVPKQIAATLKTGQAVSMDGSTSMAIVQSSYGSSNDQMASYGYPATSGDATTGKDNATDKWVITPVTNMKGVLGRLDINFPADVERNILIHQQTDNKFITSVSRNDKIYTIAPGQYRFVLETVPVENVPIQKGHETRLKMGFLNLVSEGDWHLFNDTKEKQYTSGNKPKKIPLPVGSYQLKLGTQFYPMIIKDGETVEY
jgi:hypothetical protein